MSYHAYRKLIGQPHPNVELYDYTEHPWYADKPDQRFEARLKDGYGSIGLRGTSPQAALDSLTRHLCKDGTHTWADGTASYIDTKGVLQHLTVDQQDALHWQAMENDIEDTGFYEHP